LIIHGLLLLLPPLTDPFHTAACSVASVIAVKLVVVKLVNGDDAIE